MRRWLRMMLVIGFGLAGSLGQGLHPAVFAQETAEETVVLDAEEELWDEIAPEEPAADPTLEDSATVDQPISDAAGSEVAAEAQPESATPDSATPDDLDLDEEEFLLEPEFETERVSPESSKAKPSEALPESRSDEAGEAPFEEDEEWDEIEPGAASAELSENAAATQAQIPTVLTNLEDCKRVALLNDRRVQVAIKEIKYQRYRLLEAERIFLPQLKATWERQEGESAEGSSDQAFKGLKYGLEGQQLLFNGGKLVYGLKQAKTNLDVAKKKYEQARQELIVKVEKAYYDLVKSQMVFEIQADLSKAAESALSFSREAYRQGLNAYHEYLNVQSQTDQTYFQLLSSQQEIALAELKLRQACNVDAATGIQINAVLTFTDFEFNYSLDECLELGFKNRPDLAVNELTTLADLYGIKMAKAEGLPKLEFLGSIGKNGQNKSGESLSLSDEYMVKLQATWMVGANTAQYSYERKKTTPTDFGVQNNTKESITHNASLGIFDKLENFSNFAKAQMQKATSEADLVELRGKVANEVEENYFNYQKAMTMVTASLSKIKFREKDLEVNRAKQMMNDVPLSQVLTAELALGEERVNYVKALADYYTSIGGLFKAMGLSK